MDNEKISTAIHSASGIAAGYVSNFTSQPTHAVGVAAILLVLTTSVVKQFMDEEDTKWWIGNGIAPFLLLWVVFSIFFYNL